MLYVSDHVSDLYCYTCFIKDALLKFTYIFFLGKSFTSAESKLFVFALVKA